MKWLTLDGLETMRLAPGLINHSSEEAQSLPGLRLASNETERIFELPTSMQQPFDRCAPKFKVGSSVQCPH